MIVRQEKKVDFFLIVLGVLLIIVAGVFTWVFNGDRIAYLFAEQNVLAMNSSEMEKGKSYKIENGMVIDMYYFNDKAGYYFMVAMTPDHKLFGLNVEAGKRELLEKMMSEFDNYVVKGGEDNLPKTSFDGKGGIFPMSKDDIPYFDEKIAELKNKAAYAELLSDAEPMYVSVELIPVSKVFNLASIFWFIFALGMLFAGGYLIVGAFRKKKEAGDNSAEDDKDETSEEIADDDDKDETSEEIVDSDE
ncbi:MAG: hypothetical protein KBS85_08240 [Lachnospiraceae bacterium]|nr:hypothetical protein [Candidatus Merdinaster equi]